MPRFSKQIKYKPRYKNWQVVELDDDIVELRHPAQKYQPCIVETSPWISEIQNQLKDLTSALAIETIKVQKLSEQCRNFGVSHEEISDILDKIEDEYFSEGCDNETEKEALVREEVEAETNQTFDEDTVEFQEVQKVMENININHLDVFLACDPDDEKLLSCAILVVQNQLEDCGNFREIENATSKIDNFLQLKFFLKLFVGVHGIIEKQNVRENLLAQIGKLADRSLSLQMDQKEQIWLLHLVTEFYEFVQTNEVPQEVNFTTCELEANQTTILGQTNFLGILIKLCTCQVLAMKHYCQLTNVI